MDGGTARAVRVPISLRLPGEIMGEIDAYAKKSGVRKTDAFLHFLQIGIASEQAKHEEDRLKGLESRLDEILAIVRRAEGAGPNAALADARDAVSAAAVHYPAIRQAYLFGSVARGTAGANSDIDVRLVVDRAAGFNLRDLEHFCKSVEQMTGRQVDAITSRVVKDKALAAAIERDKVLVYEREED